MMSRPDTSVWAYATLGSHAGVLATMAAAVPRARKSRRVIALYSAHAQASVRCFLSMIVLVPEYSVPLKRRRREREPQGIAETRRARRIGLQIRDERRLVRRGHLVGEQQRVDPVGDFRGGG